ncbi:hypothetical protein PMAYCL1PPCAC_16670, partial [Pristionchus mayeri]
GIFCVIMIQPGAFLSHSEAKKSLLSGDLEPLDTFLDFMRNMFPGNVFKATFQRMETKYTRNYRQQLLKVVVDRPGTNILG